MTLLGPALQATLWLIDRWGSPLISGLASAVPGLAALIEGGVSFALGRVEWMGVAVSVPALLWGLGPWIAFELLVGIVLLRLFIRQAARAFTVAAKVWGWTPFG